MILELDRVQEKTKFRRSVEGTVKKNVSRSLLSCKQKNEVKLGSKIKQFFLKFFTDRSKTIFRKKF